MSSRAATKTDSKLAARLAALASLGAAVIHFAVVPAHWQEWKLAGVFFTGIALFQLIWAGLVLARATTQVLAAGILLNIGAVALWAVSRTAGAPFGPHAGEAELVQAADLCALLLQVYVVMGAGWVWHRRHQGEPIPAFANAMVLLGVGAVVALASTVGAASGLRHGDHGPAGAEAGHHGSSGGDDGGHHAPAGVEAEQARPSVEHEGGHHEHPAPAAEPLHHGSTGAPAPPVPQQVPPPAAEPLHHGSTGAPAPPVPQQVPPPAAEPLHHEAGDADHHDH
ncbi:MULTISPECIES: hypothetical protein [Mycolicibacterium]|uniref:hypothetical protein n=1 Tax=Mycolicibacterium TaxID=1866885 RepID=UPI001F250F90|nr:MULTISPECIES: hypothetical protein [Mycolicibacterium]